MATFEDGKWHEDTTSKDKVQLESYAENGEYSELLTIKMMALFLQTGENKNNILIIAGIVVVVDVVILVLIKKRKKL